MLTFRSIDRATFFSEIEDALPQISLTPALRDIFRLSVRNLFRAFDYNGDGVELKTIWDYAHEVSDFQVIDVDEFVRGLALLGRSNKNQSLELVFNMMDTDRNGEISMDEMNDFFASFLLVTCAISDETLDLPPEYLKSIVFKTAHQVKN